MVDMDCSAAIEQIKIVKAQYCRFADAKDWVGFFALFSDDIEFEISAGLVSGDDDPESGFQDSGIRSGKDGFRTYISEAAAVVKTSVHHCHLPEITMVSQDSATGIWAMEDRLVFIDGFERHELHGFGYYYETYRREREVWRIQKISLRRLRVDVS